MVYHCHFVAVVRVDGKILRERDDNTVYIPFGCQYEILLKNLNSRKAVASISIDGESIGSDVIVNPNEQFPIERFISMGRGHRFRFIQKTQEISDHRGDRLDDGIIRVEYRFEALAPQPILWVNPVVREVHHHHNYGPYWGWPYYGGSFVGSNVSFGGGTCSMSSAQPPGPEVQVNFCDRSNIPCASFGNIMPQEGVTVKGSESNQQFSYDNVGNLETFSEVIVIRLRGLQDNQPVNKPVTVKTKLTCPTCGRHQPSSAKFCCNCSTALSL